MSPKSEVRNLKQLSAVIITYNSEKLIQRVIESASFADEVIIVDSGSTDDTAKIARSLGAKVFSQKWLGYAKQKNFAISKAKGEWVLSLDSDEVVTWELKNEIQRLKDSKIESEDKNKTGYYIARKNMYYPDKWLRFGGLYPDHQLRLFKRGKGKFDEVDIHECVRVKGETGKLKSPMLHYTQESIHSHMETVNKYTELEAKRNNRKPTGYSTILKPCLYFFKHYFIKLGFLDGWQGLVYHYISARYIFIKEVKTMEKYNISGFHLFRTILKRSR